MKKHVNSAAKLALEILQNNKGKITTTDFKFLFSISSKKGSVTEKQAERLKKLSEKYEEKYRGVSVKRTPKKLSVAKAVRRQESKEAVIAAKKRKVTDLNPGEPLELKKAHANHPFLPIIKELSDNGINVSSGVSSYKLLFKLAKYKRKKMTGCAKHAAINAGTDRGKINSEAKQILTEYIKSGLLVIPKHMASGLRKESRYTHDGDATANRNTWSSNRKPSLSNRRREPVMVGGLNTVTN